MNRHRSIALCLTLALASACYTPSPTRDEPFAPPLARLDVGVGARRYDDFDSNGNGPVFFIDYEEGDMIGPFSLEGGVHYFYDQRSVDTPGGREETSNRTLEISVGLRGELRHDVLPLIPYVGVGGSILFAEVRYLDLGEIVEEDDVAFGTYAKAGLLLPLRNGSSIGVEVRQLLADTIALENRDVDLDATQIALVFGARF